MSELIAVAFKGRHEADRVLNELRRMEKGHLIDLEDACVVERKPDGKVKLNQAVNLVAAQLSGGLAWGGFIGILVGLLFLNPLAGFFTGAAIGGGLGAITGSLADYGISDDFIKALGANIEPDSSALFILVRRITPDKVIKELSKYDGEIIHTSLSEEQEDRLKATIEEHTGTRLQAEAA